MNLTWQQAHNISIVNYLSKHWHHPVYSSSGWQEYHYHSPIRQNDKTPSFHLNITKNKWHDKWLATGWDIIELVAQHHNITKSQACHYLSKSGLYRGNYIVQIPTLQKNYHHSKTPKTANTNNKYQNLEKNTSFIIQDIKPINHPALLQYQKYRCIDPKIASQYGLLEINYQLSWLPQSHYFSLAWKNDQGGYEYNSKSGEKSFKGCLGKKDITSINLQKNKKLALFESATDFWAYLTYYKITNFQNSAIILNTLNLKNKALETIKKYQPTQIYLFLDNDTQWKKTTQTLIKEIKKIPIYDKSNLYKKHKDFNEMTIEKNKTTS